MPYSSDIKPMILKRSAFFLLLILGLAYVGYTWVAKDKGLHENMIKEARTVVASISVDDVSALEGKSSDINKPQYVKLKRILMNVVHVNNQARFAYLYTLRNDRIYFIADSEPEYSKDCSHPGDEYKEAKDIDKLPFKDGKPLIQRLVQDKWGRWVSVSIPVKDELTGKVIAVYGMDFNAGSRTAALFVEVIESVFLVLLLMLVLFFLFRLRTRNHMLSCEISERNHTLQMLQESETKFHSMFFSHSAIMLLIDPLTGRIIEANSAAEKFYGYSIHQLLEMNICDINTFTKDEMQVIMNEAVNLERNLYAANHRLSTGEIRIVEVHSSPIINQGQNILFNIMHDVSERKQSEEKLTQISTRLSLATRAAGVGVWELDVVNNKLWWDDQMLALYGIERENFKGEFETRNAGIHPDDLPENNEHIRMAIQGEKEFDKEFRVCWPDGSVHNIKALAAVLRNEAGEPLRMIGTNWDITKEKQSSQKLLETNLYLESATAQANEMAAKAERANKSKSLFLANMSHEIRTPLNAIIGFSQLMDRDQQLTKQQKDYCYSITRAGEHLLSLINDILELSKMEAGRAKLNLSNVHLLSLLDDIQMIFKERAFSKHLSFVFEPAYDLPSFIVTDESKLRQIFVNLIGNAIKFTDQGGVSVRLYVDRVDSRKCKLLAEIKDTGPGIPAHEISKLFKHFEQTGSGMRKGSGTGLGLALSRELACLMGGDITVTSVEGKGSVFTFWVEIENGQAGLPVPALSNRILGIDKGGRSYKILVVDDNPDNMTVAVRLLNMAGFDTCEAVNGEDAITKFEMCSPDLILMDIRMPALDGYGATRRIRSTSNGKNTPVVVLSASAFEVDRKMLETYDIQGYIHKPFRANDLYQTLGEILDVKYIYEEDVSAQNTYSDQARDISGDIYLLPDNLLKRMQEAVSAADLDELIELIHEIENEYADLAKELLLHANNYDYDYLSKLLTTKQIR